VAGLGLEAGDEVSDEHLRRMLVEVVDPVTGELLGRQAAGQPLSVAERVGRRLARLDPAARDGKGTRSRPGSGRRHSIRGLRWPVST